MAGLVDRLSMLVTVDGVDQAGAKFKKLGAESKQGIDKTTDSTSKLGSALNAAGPMAAAAGAAIVAFGVQSIHTFEDAAGETLKLQRYLGGTAEEASSLRFAAQQSGITIDQLAVGLKGLSKELVNKPADFEKYGIATKDAEGHTLSLHDVLLNTAEQFQKMPNGAEKTAEAVRLFGKAGADLIPMLNKGKDGIQSLEKATADYGLLLSGKNLNDLKASRTAQRELSASVQGLQVQIGQRLVPAVTELTQQLGGLVRISTQLPNTYDKVNSATGNFSKNMLEATPIVGTFMRALDIKDGVDKLTAGTKTGAASVDELSKATGISKDKVQEWVDASKAAGTTYGSSADMIGALTKEEGDNADATANASAKATTFKDHLDAVNSSLKDAQSELDGATSKLTGYFDVITGGLDKESQYQASVDALTEAVKKNGATTDLNTEAGRSNLSAVEDVRKAILDKAEAAAKDSGNVQTGIDMANLYSTSLYNQLLNLGWTKKAAADYIAQLGLTPPQINTAFSQSGMQQAFNDVRTYTQMLANIDGKVVAVGVLTEFSNSVADLKTQFHGQGITFRAKGGMVPDGYFMVGEDGPELMRKQGGQVEIGSNPSTVGGHKINGGGTSGTASGGNTYNLNFPNYLGSKDELKGWIADSMRQLERAAS